jgi:PA14 domain-containing protein
VTLLSTRPSTPRRNRRRLWIGPALFLLTVAAVRASLGVTTGLDAKYFDPTISERVPTIEQVDAVISTDAVDRTWLGQAPSVFSVAWSGFVNVPRSGRYRFALTSDDGSAMGIDGRVVVDNSGRHGPVTRSAQIDLDAGPHLLALDYSQQGGAYAIELTWSSPDGTTQPIPSWLLSTRRTRYWKLALARVLDAALLAGWIAVAGLVLVSVTRRPRQIAAALQRRPRLATLGLFVALAALETWPIARNPAHLSRNDNGDAVLNEWTIAWVVHQATHAPLHLYDANIFYPDSNTLSYSEAMIVQSAFAAPVLWLGGSPVLAYNLVLLAGFALTGWSMCLVISRWTADWTAGMLAGVIFAFNGHTLTRIPQLQAHHVEFLPAALFFLDALLRRPRVQSALALAFWFALQALTSVHLMVFAAVAIAASVLVRFEDWFGRRFVPVFGSLMLAGAVAAVPLIPYLLPYWRLRYESGLSRPLQELAFYSSSWRSYLGTPSRVHFPLWSHFWFTGDALFPGLIGLMLACTALYLRGPLRDRRVRMCLAIGVSGVALSFGPSFPGYSLLYRFVPVLQGIRVVSRFGYLAIVAVAMLAGFGFATLRQELSTRSVRLGTVFTACILPLAVIETLAIPLGLTPFRRIPPFYDQLRNDAEAVIVELPLAAPRFAFGNTSYMLASTVHWRPLVNGYSGLTPPSYYRHFAAMQTFPDLESVTALQGEGVTRIVVHTDAVAPALIAQMDAVPQLHRVRADGRFLLYALDRPANK